MLIYKLLDAEVKGLVARSIDKAPINSRLKKLL